MKRSYFLVFALIILSGLYESGSAQDALTPRLSPLYMTTMKFENIYIKITYGRPHKKDREIFGGVVPYGKVWRTGANETTELTATGNIYLSGKLLEKGTYSIFTIPGINKWTIIINTALGQWGAFEYDQNKDVLRFDVPVKMVDQTYEPFTIEFTQDDSNFTLDMLWDQVKVSIPLSFP